MTAWDSLTAKQRADIEWGVADMRATFHGQATDSDICRWVVERYASAHAPENYEDAIHDSYDLGHEDGKTAGWTECEQALRFLAEMPT